MTAEKMFSVMVLKFPGVAGLGLGEGKGREVWVGVQCQGLQTFILFKQKTIPFTTLFSWPDPFP